MIIRAGLLSFVSIALTASVVEAFVGPKPLFLSSPAINAGKLQQQQQQQQRVVLSVSSPDKAADATEVINDEEASTIRVKPKSTRVKSPFKNVMAANRAEIAVRIMRAATEMNAGTVAIYCHEDRYSQHRLGADRSYKLEKAVETATPISTYLDIKQIIQIAKDANVDAIHPGYVIIFLFLFESKLFWKIILQIQFNFFSAARNECSSIL